MKKRINQSLLVAEIAGFMMFMLVYIVNTNKPYLLFIPVAGAMVGYFAFPVLLHKWMDRKFGNVIWGIVILSGLLALFIAVSTIGLITIL